MKYNAYSSPVYADGKVYISGGENALIALDTGTGDEKWKYESRGATFSSPVIDGGLVCIGGMGGYIHAVDAVSGEEKWKYDVGRYGVVSTAAVSKGVVYCGGMYNYLFALDLKTGKEKWRFETERITFPEIHDKKGDVIGFGRAITPVRTNPAIGRGVVCFGDEKGRFYGLDIETGKEKWKFETIKHLRTYIRTIPHVRGLIYTGSNDGCLYALDIVSGKVKWKFEAGNYRVNSPTADDDLVCFSCEETLYGVDAETGREKWRFETNGRVFDAPLLADGVVYFGSSDHHLYALKYSSQHHH